MNYVFISYSSKNQQVADSVRFLLKKNGISCWMAPYDIPIGSSYAYVINDALENCSCLLLLLTNASQTSEWVEKEVGRAISCKKPILPMQLEDLELNPGFKFYLENSQITAVPKICADSPAFIRILSEIKKFVTSDGNNISGLKDKADERIERYVNCMQEKLDNSMELFVKILRSSDADEQYRHVQKFLDSYADVYYFYMQNQRVLGFLKEQIDSILTIHNQLEVFLTEVKSDGHELSDLDFRRMEAFLRQIYEQLQDMRCALQNEIAHYRLIKR